MYLRLITGKKWGNAGGKRILAVHGVQDNCGVFDRIIPTLRGDYQVICIDLPGHGYSSHFPAGIPIELLNFVLSLVYVVKDARWDKFLFVGHSLGGQIGLLFAALYPECVEKLIVIDHIFHTYAANDKIVTLLRKSIDRFVTLQSRIQEGDSPTYTYAEALQKMTERLSALNEEAATIVLKRSLEPTENGYRFCMDQRLKLHMFPTLTSVLAKDVIKHANCPILFVFSSERYGVYRQIFREVWQLLLQKKNVSIKVVSGNHDFHQNHPDRIVDIIDEFFASEHCKL